MDDKYVICHDDWKSNFFIWYRYRRDKLSIHVLNDKVHIYGLKNYKKFCLYLQNNDDKLILKYK